MTTYFISLVVQGLLQILKDKGDALRNGIGFDAKIVAISDVMKGSIYNPDGLASSCERDGEARRLSGKSQSD